jgi:putative peptidoglycan lipid II flippase
MTVADGARPHRIAQAAVLVAVVAVAARTAGFVRVLVFAHVVGPSCLGDTYYTANTVPNIVFDIVAGGALSSLVVPVLAGAVDAGDTERADRTLSALLSWTLLLLVPVTVLGLLFTRPLMTALVGGGHPGCDRAAEIAAGARMLAVFMPQVLLYGAAVVLIGALQAHRRFLAPAIAPLVSSVVVIGAYVAFASVAATGETSLTGLTRGHELILSAGTTVGVAAICLPLLRPVRRTGRRLRPTLAFPPGVAATARRMAIAGAVVLGSQDLATAVVLRLANDSGSQGAVVLFNLAWTVFLLPWSVLAVPIATAAFPTLTARWDAGDRAAYAGTAARTTRAVLLVCFAAAGIVVATSIPAARVLILGAPGQVEPRLLARALVAFAPGLVGYGLVAHLSRAHYAQGDARVPAAATATGWAVAVVADVVGVSVVPRDWAVAALGAGTSIGATVAGGWLLASLRRRAGAEALRAVPRAAAAGLAGSIAAATAAGAVAVLLPAGGVGLSAAAVALVGVLAVAVYLGLVWCLDKDSIRVVLRRRFAGG